MALTVSDHGTTTELTVTPLWPGLGAVITGVDLAQPINEQLATDLYDAFIAFRVLLFPGQTLAPADEEATFACFDTVPTASVYGTQFRLDGHPAIRVLSNMVHDDGSRVGIVMGKQGPEWHCDGTAAQQAPAASQLYCLEANDIGGDTLFADGQTAFDLLPADTRARIVDLVATYNSDHLQRKLAVYDSRPVELTGAPDSHWPIALVHPVTGRRGLYFSGGEMVAIEGLNEAQRLALVEELSAHLFAHQYLFRRHHWTPGDVLVWDNRAVMHSASQYDYDGHGRLLHHIVGAT